MDLTELSSLSSVLALLVPLVFTAVLFLWVIFRTESRHTLRYRIWQLIQGNRDISDPEIAAYINEQNSLMSFRFIAGVPVRSLEHAHQLILWTKRHRVEMFALRMAGEYFDSETRQILVHKLPSKFFQALKVSLMALSVPIVLGCVALTYTDDALVKLRTTDQWILLSESRAQVLWPWTAAALSKTACTADEKVAVKNTRLDDTEGKILCEILADTNTASYLKTVVKGQRQSAIVLACLTVVAAWMLLMVYMSGFVAARLARRHIPPDFSDEQLQLDFETN